MPSVGEQFERSIAAVRSFLDQPFRATQSQDIASVASLSVVLGFFRRTYKVANVSQNGLEELMERRFAGICIFVVTLTENMKQLKKNRVPSKTRPLFLWSTEDLCRKNAKWVEMGVRTMSQVRLCAPMYSSSPSTQTLPYNAFGHLYGHSSRAREHNGERNGLFKNYKLYSYNFENPIVFPIVFPHGVTVTSGHALRPLRAGFEAPPSYNALGLGRKMQRQCA